MQKNTLLIIVLFALSFHGAKANPNKFSTGKMVSGQRPLVFASPDQSEPVKVTSAINKVTVFLRGAQVERTGNKIVEAGITRLKFDYLSPDIDPNSINVNGTGEFTILSVTHGLNYLREGRTHSKVLLMEDSLKSIENKINLTNRTYQALEEEKNMVIANKIVNNNSGFDVEDLDDLANYYRKRLAGINTEQVNLQNEEEKLTKLQQQIKNQIQELSVKWNKATSEVTVEVMSKTRTNARINLSYVVRNAGWIPVYDIRVKDTASPTALNYKAKVYQNSGTDWENVSLVLSTGNPQKSATKPELRPWMLRFLPVYQTLGVTDSRGGDKPESKSQAYKRGPVMEGSLADDAEAPTAAQYTAVVENQLSTTFEIQIPYTVPADGKYHEVSIQSHELPATYRYFAAPKVDKEAFLLAKISGWDKINLLPGEANIFYEGTYTGKSQLNPQSTDDTLDLSLGRDKDIVIERKMVEEFTKTQTVGQNKIETSGIEITIRNTKSVAVDIDMMDQVPISTDKDIQVEILEISGGKQDLKTGYLDWRIRLEPAQTITILVKYSVKYPKDKKVNL